MTEAEEQEVIEMREYLQRLGARGDEGTDEEILALARGMESQREWMKRNLEEQDRRRWSSPFYRARRGL
jgi:hypothetical protein